MSRRVVVGMAGREGLEYGIAFLRALGDAAVETHLVLTDETESALGTELDDVRRLADQVYAPGNQAARVASGSFLTRGMAIVPCDAGSVAAITLGLARNLLYRAADVTLKERRPLVLGLTPAALAAVDRTGLARAREIPGLALRELDGTVETAVAQLLAALDF